MSQFIQTNHIKLHCLNFEGGKPTIILTHGLTANAHIFDGLIKEGLSPAYNVISVDLRGRGLSDKPEKGYSMEAHAQDLIGLLDALQIQSAVIGGHSFGALLTFFLAAHYPERVEKMILMDAAAQMHPNTRELLQPVLSRLGEKTASFEMYLQKVKQTSFLVNQWDDMMESYYRADVQDNPDGTVQPRSNPANILEAVESVLTEPWLEYIPNIEKTAILLNATGAYGPPDAPPLLPKELALETVHLMKNCQYTEVTGNHQTMLYGKGAGEIVQAIKKFLVTVPK